MKEFFSTKSFKAFIITLSLLILISVFTHVDNSVVSSVFNTLTVSMQEVSAEASNKIVKKDYDELEKDNKDLSEEVANLRAQLVDYYDVKQENSRLWKYYDLKKTNPTYDLLPASVIRRDPNDEFYSFTMDKGLASGVAVNDVVVTENGLVGWIYQVDATTSKVRTILSDEIKVGAIDKVTRDSGVIKGNVKYADKNLTTFSKISASNTMKPGEVIVTTGISGIYPANLVIGEIKELKHDEFDTSLYAVIEPFENIKTVSDVVIITGFTGQGEVFTKEHVKKAEEKASEEAAKNKETKAEEEITTETTTEETMNQED